MHSTETKLVECPKCGARFLATGTFSTHEEDCVTPTQQAVYMAAQQEVYNPVERPATQSMVAQQMGIATAQTQAGLAQQGPSLRSLLNSAREKDRDEAQAQLNAQLAKPLTVEMTLGASEDVRGIAYVPLLCEKPMVNAVFDAGPPPSKAPLHLVLCMQRALWACARQLEQGTDKRGRKAGDWDKLTPAELVDKIGRHLVEYAAGRLVDDTGQSHLAAIMADAAIALELEGKGGTDG